MKPRALPSRSRVAFPLTQVEDEEGRIHLLIHLPIEEYEDRWCLWRPDHAGFDSRSIFEGALDRGIDRQTASRKAGFRSNAPLFQTFQKKRPTGRVMSRSEAYRMIRRRALDASLFAPVCCHSHRATGIAVYLENKGTLETAQKIAAHESPRTTKLHDRTDDQLTLDEIEKISVNFDPRTDARSSFDCRHRFFGERESRGSATDCRSRR
jgi:hypothetical protein